MAYSDGIYNGDDESPKADLRPDRINRKRLVEATDEQISKKLIVCRKNSKTGATEILHEDLSSFVAQQCSKDIDQSVHKRGLSYYTVRCADDELVALEFVLDWIKKCGEQRDEVKVEQDTLPTVDPANPLDFPVKVLVIAGRLKIPWASFGRFLIKHYVREARNHVIDLDLVRDMYDELNPDFKTIPAIRELAYTSIFEAWYNFKIDTDEYADYCCELSDLRDRFPELDNDLHAAVTAKKEFLIASRLKRQQKREKEEEEARALRADEGVSDRYHTSHDSQIDGVGGERINGNENGAVWSMNSADEAIEEWDKPANDHIDRST